MGLFLGIRRLGSLTNEFAVLSLTSTLSRSASILKIIELMEAGSRRETFADIRTVKYWVRLNHQGLRHGGKVVSI